MCDVGLIISIQPIQDSLERDVIERQLALALSPSSSDSTSFDGSCGVRHYGDALVLNKLHIAVQYHLCQAD